MGDKSRMALYSMLLDFLEQHGRPLIEYGSADRGLTIEDARTFIELLHSNRVPLRGIEFWRNVGTHLDLDIKEIWYPIHEGFEERHSDAVDYFNSFPTTSAGVFAIQFG